MLLNQIAQKMDMKPANDLVGDVEVTGGCASDLLSDVLAKAKNGTLWVTNQKHQNIIGVAVMLNLAGVVVVGGIAPENHTIQKSVEENVPLYTSEMSMFELVGELHDLGLRSC